MPALRRPIDGGATLRGRRVLGDNKTWRGAIVMFAGSAGAAAALTRARPFRNRLRPELARSPAAYAALLGLSTVVSELPTSFAKRQLDIAPGSRRASPVGAAFAVLDQGDFVLGSALILRPLWRMSARDVAEAFAVVAGAHMVVNVIGYAIGARTSPL